jgi:hypothetical protein
MGGAPRGLSEAVQLRPFSCGRSVAARARAHEASPDLPLANETQRPLQLRTWLTDDEVRGEIRSDLAWPHAYRIVERGHRFVREPGLTVLRENEPWRLTLDASGVERCGRRARDGEPG